MSSRLDLIIFGATGFTGKYAIEELVNITSIDPSITWGIAGRSQIKLEKVIQDVEKKNGVDLSKIKIFLADVSDPESLTNMTKQAKVLVNCCGPYRFYGEAVVKACVETMTSHVDVSGEPAYMEKMQLEYSEAAEKAGVYIVSACGFDSIPADMGVVFMQQQFKGQLNGVESYIGLKTDPASRRWGEASIHYGTWESLVYGIAKQSELAPLRRKLYPVKLPCFMPKLKSRSIIHKSSMDGRWYLPFPGSDASVVYRSQRFFYEKDKQRPLYMKPYFGLPSFFHIIPVILMAIILGVMSMFSFGRKMLLKHPRIFSFGVMSHEGPSELAMKNTDFWMDLYGQGWDESVKDIEAVRPNKTIHVKVAGINPGYGTTNITLLFSAITILRESDKMPGNGGVFPPGYAFAKTSLIEKLNANNVTFEVIEQKMINQ